MRFHLLFCSVVICFIWVAWASAEEINESFVESEVKFAIEELRGLSDSGVYESLTLGHILSSSVEDGTYHSTTTLHLALNSPYFKSGKTLENFEMMVLTHKEDGVKSLAIDEFPQMTDLAVEEFLIKKNTRKRTEREEAFRLLEVKAILSKRGEESQSSDLRTLLGKLDSDEQRNMRSQASLQIQKRIVEPFISQEKELSSLSLVSLYDISLGVSDSGRAWSDYQIERARHILDASLNS